MKRFFCSLKNSCCANSCYEKPCSEGCLYMKCFILNHYTIKMKILSFCIEYSNLLSQNSFIHKVSTQVWYRCKKLKINAKIFYFNKISRALSWSSLVFIKALWVAMRSNPSSSNFWNALKCFLDRSSSKLWIGRTYSTSLTLNFSPGLRRKTKYLIFWFNENLLWYH